MYLLTEDESKGYFKNLKISDSLTDYKNLCMENDKEISIPYPKVQNMNQLSNVLVDSARYSEWHLLLLTSWWIFPSSEDANLYYSFQKYHGGTKPYYEMPGHLFMNHEIKELATLITICCANLYDAIVISQLNISRIHLSHDEFVDVYTKENSIIEDLKKYHD